MPPIIYLNEISDKEKIFIDLSIYTLWIFYFYEFGSFIREIFLRETNTIKSQKTLAEKEYQTGISTQIPINATYKPSRDKKSYRFSRKISYRNLKLLKVSE